MHTEQRTEPIEKAVVHVNVGPETEGGAFDLKSYLDSIKAGYHVVYDDKMPLVVAADNLVVWGASYMNARGKHHCLVGQADQTEAQWLDVYSRGEMELLAFGLALDCQKYGLEPRRLSVPEVHTPGVKGICGHIDVTNAFKADGVRDGVILDHWDPGPNFPWTLLTSRVVEIIGGVIHTGGTDNMKSTDQCDACVTKRLGRYILQRDGGVLAYGAGAPFFGSYPGLKPTPAPLEMGKNHAVSMMLTPDEGGYWILMFDGGLYSFGNAQFYGSFQKDGPGFLQLVEDGIKYAAIRRDAALA